MGGAEDTSEREDDVIVVGFTFMAKKMEGMAKVTAIGPCEGVEFAQLDFSRRPDKHERVHVILHKLSDDIMFRKSRPEGHARLSWIEEYLTGHPETVIVDPIERVANVINRVMTLELLTEAYLKHGKACGMPRPPRFVLLREAPRTTELTRATCPWASHGFPVICKPVEACGTRGSHTMVVVLDKAGMDALKTPIVVQEYKNHSGKLFKVSVVGEDVRVHGRSSLPDLPSGLFGSFTFDSQKTYPTLAEIEAMSEATARARGLPTREPLTSRKPEDDLNASPIGQRAHLGLSASSSKGGMSRETSPPPSISLGAAKIAARHMRDIFGLSIFGFDLIVDAASGEAMVIDVNYFPSFKDLSDFPQVLRKRLREVVNAPPVDNGSRFST